MTAELRETLAAVREGLAECGVEVCPASQALQDQIQTAFRVDLAANGVRPSTTEEMAAAVVGLTCAIKPMVQQDLPLLSVAMFVGLCECLVPMIDAPMVDPGELPDLDFLSDIEFAMPQAIELCTNCHENEATFRLPNGSRWCHVCVAKAAPLLGSARPQVGGPGFEREEMADVGPKSWRDLTVSELFSKISKLIRRQHG
jgi:hypothetical protein